MPNLRPESELHSDLPERTRVAIIGAGPTGLTAALALASKGIDCVIVDKSAPHAGRSRAATVMPMSLEILEEFGVCDELVSHGLKLNGFAGWDRKRRLAAFAFAQLDTKYPYCLVIPQSLTEQLLESRLAEAGRKVHRPLELAGFDQDQDGVVLAFTDGQTLRADYVIGADGGHSRVREAAGIKFTGYKYPVSVVLADVDVDLDPARSGVDAAKDEDRVRGFLTPHGSMAVVPLPSGRWRIAAPMHGAVRDPDLGDVRTLIRLRAPHAIPGEVVGLEWASHFQVQRRLAERYRAGRVFLAGDAAHVHSPVAGQGMNVGIQDGANIGRKLAYVLAGGDPCTLDAYETERQEVAEKVLRATDRLTRSLMIHTRFACMVRNSVVRVVGTSTRAQNRMAFVNSQLVYRDM